MVEGRSGGGYSTIDIFVGSGGNRNEHMIGHRIKEIDIVARRGRDPFAADIELVCLCTREIAAVHGRHRAFPSCTNANGFGARAATVTCTERNSHPSGKVSISKMPLTSASVVPGVSA